MLALTSHFMLLKPPILLPFFTIYVTEKIEVVSTLIFLPLHLPASSHHIHPSFFPTYQSGRIDPPLSEANPLLGMAAIKGKET